MISQRNRTQVPLLRLIDADNLNKSNLVTQEAYDLLKTSQTALAKKILDKGIWRYINGQEMRIDETQEINGKPRGAPATVVKAETVLLTGDDSEGKTKKKYNSNINKNENVNIFGGASEESRSADAGTSSEN